MQVCFPLLLRTDWNPNQLCLSFLTPVRTASVNEADTKLLFSPWERLMVDSSPCSTQTKSPGTNLANKFTKAPFCLCTHGITNSRPTHSAKQKQWQEWAEMEEQHFYQIYSVIFYRGALCGIYKKISSITTTHTKRLHRLDEFSGTLLGTCGNLNVEERVEEPPCWHLNSASQKTEQLVLRSYETRQSKLTLCTLYFTHYYLVIMLFPPITDIISLPPKKDLENPTDHQSVKRQV